jgi:excisionase family DNA binding protein
MELNDEILTIQELAERLKVKRSTVYELTRREDE